MDLAEKIDKKINGSGLFSQGAPNPSCFPAKKSSKSPQLVDTEVRGKGRTQHLLSVFHVPSLSLHFFTGILMLQSGSIITI